MDRIFAGTEWKPEASAGKHSQVPMPFMSEVPLPHQLDASVLARLSFSGALNEAAKNSGLEDQQIADQIHISHGYMSKFMRGVGQSQAKRLIAFMNVTNSIAPLQCIAQQIGCEVVVRSTVQRELAETRARLAELERYERMAA